MGCRHGISMGIFMGIPNGILVGISWAYHRNFHGIFDHGIFMEYQWGFQMERSLRQKTPEKNSGPLQNMAEKSAWQIWRSGCEKSWTKGWWFSNEPPFFISKGYIWHGISWWCNCGFWKTMFFVVLSCFIHNWGEYMFIWSSHQA